MYNTKYIFFNIFQSKSPEVIQSISSGPVFRRSTMKIPTFLISNNLFNFT